MGSIKYILKLIFLLILVQILIPRINLYSQDATKIKSSLDYIRDNRDSSQYNSIQSLINIKPGYKNKPIRVQGGKGRCTLNYGEIIEYKLSDLRSKDTFLLYLDGLELNSKTNNDIEHYLKTNNLSIKSYILEDNITNSLQEKDYFPTKKEKELYPTLIEKIKEAMFLLKNNKSNLQEEIDISYCKPGNLISIYLEIENTNKIVLVQFISIEGELYFLQSKIK